jgi:hypothetical protein
MNRTKSLIERSMDAMKESQSRTEKLEAITVVLITLALLSLISITVLA